MKAASVAIALILVLAPMYSRAERNSPVTKGTITEASRLHRMFGEYTIAGPDATYYVEERLIKTRLVPLTAPAHVTVNGSVDYFIVGNKLRFIDNDGKEHTATIVREVAPGGAN